MNVKTGCPPPIFDSTDDLTVASPISTQRPGCYSKSYPIHLEAGKFYTFRLTGTIFSNVSPGPRRDTGSPSCDTYFYLLDSIGNVVAENDDSPMQLSSGVVVLIEIEGDYTMECTTFSPGVTGTIRTVVNNPCISLEFAGNSSAAGTGSQYFFTAPQSVPPLTWDIVDGSLPPEITIANDVFTPNLVFGKIIGGNDNSYTSRTFKLRVTDGNGMERITPVNWKCIGFDGFRIYPTFMLAPPIGQPFAFQMIPVGGVAPYIFSGITNGGLPGGLSFDQPTGVISGTADGSLLPTSANWTIVDSEGDFSVVGITFDTCVGQNPVSNLIWTVTPTTPIPPGDSVTGSIAGGDGVLDLVNIYPGVGPCATDPTVVTLSAQLCSPITAPIYDLELTVRFTGTLGNSPVCPATGRLQWSIQGFGFQPPGDVSGTGGQIYDTSTLPLPAKLYPGNILNISILVGVTYADCHLQVTLRPLAPPTEAPPPAPLAPIITPQLLFGSSAYAPSP